MSLKQVLTSLPWSSGMKHYINKLQWGEPEVQNVVNVLYGDWFGGNSEYNKAFEAKLVKFSGHKYAQTTNSGSAALELAIQALLQTGRIKKGAKFLAPRLNFPTSISAAIMAGCVPVYVDVGVATYVIDADCAERALNEHPDIEFAIIPALIGNAPNMDRLTTILGNRPIVMDSCDVMGTKWDRKEIAGYATIACYSFYGSHHISTFGVGGGVVTSDEELFEFIHSLTFWGREFKWDKEQDEVVAFLNRYRYKTLGMDAQMSAVQAAFGLAQFDRLPMYVYERWKHKTELDDIFRRYQGYFILPERTHEKADVSWFGYPLLIKPNRTFTRYDFVKFLLSKNVEIRPIFTDLLDNEPFQKAPYYLVGEYPNAIYTNANGVFIPSFPMGDEQKEEYHQIIREFLRKL